MLLVFFELLLLVDSELDLFMEVDHPLEVALDRQKLSLSYREGQAGLHLPDSLSRDLVVLDDEELLLGEQLAVLEQNAVQLLVESVNLGIVLEALVQLFEDLMVNQDALVRVREVLVLQAVVDLVDLLVLVVHGDPQVLLLRALRDLQRVRADEVWSLRLLPELRGFLLEPIVLAEAHQALHHLGLGEVASFLLELVVDCAQYVELRVVFSVLQPVDLREEAAVLFGFLRLCWLVLSVLQPTRIVTELVVIQPLLVHYLHSLCRRLEARPGRGVLASACVLPRRRPRGRLVL